MRYRRGLMRLTRNFSPLRSMAAEQVTRGVRMRPCRSRASCPDLTPAAYLALTERMGTSRRPAGSHPPATVCRSMPSCCWSSAPPRPGCSRKTPLSWAWRRRLVSPRTYARRERELGREGGTGEADRKSDQPRDPDGNANCKSHRIVLGVTSFFSLPNNSQRRPGPYTRTRG